MAWLDLKSEGMHNIPGVPKACFVDIANTLLKLHNREGQTRPAENGLSVNYTIGGQTASAYDFLIGKPQLRALSLDEPKQFTVSWTTYQDVYKQATHDNNFDTQWAGRLTSATEATRQFWPMIDRNLGDRL